MKDGNYKLDFDWRGIESPNLNLLKLQKKHCLDEYKTCGTGAISLLTGLHPKYIEQKLPTGRKHWSDTSLCRFLQKRGYKTTQLTKRLVTSFSSKCIYIYLPYNIKENHCLLLNSLVCENEASFFVIHKNSIYHNFAKYDVSPLFWVNRPTQSIFIVSHEKWK